MHDNTVALVKSLSAGRCGCYHINGSASSATHDPATGEVMPGHYDPGQLVKCMRCKAREALEADGIDYVKDDRETWAVYS
jgi:hypothetical protein